MDKYSKRHQDILAKFKASNTDAQSQYTEASYKALCQHENFVIGVKEGSSVHKASLQQYRIGIQAARDKLVSSSLLAQRKLINDLSCESSDDVRDVLGLPSHIGTVLDDP